MKVRGERECRACGARWSYYETGSVECPDCGSLRSVGVDDRTAHTDAQTTLDLSAHRARFGDASGTLPDEGVDDLKSDLRAYARKRGFIRGGELLPLDDTYLAARELLEAVDLYDRLRDPTDRDREYLLALLAGADAGDRPATDAVPDALREARGMAAVRAVDEYRTDLLAFLDELDALDELDKFERAEEAEETEGDEGTEEAAGADTEGEGADTDASAPAVSVSGADPLSRTDPTRALLERLRDRAKRVEALTGDVPPGDADALVDAADALGEYVRTGDETALDRARDRLSDDLDRQ
ncbi:DUF7117 family protein [Halorubrum kocurii]|uniref:TFIIB-type zinc ribbon-containing protein n=1 Tax=Halorubrum kocurii JCM 14978 TaxID=1230456 RepID=M0P4R0_9EURY|nr:hypothetical protein [Halorubrum kocurii]EMA63820.1 hypothetical protein C468_09459 [Halorubrum kocurii JCM 14978]